jgi:uncharacterized phage protein (TIGR02218 family)
LATSQIGGDTGMKNLSQAMSTHLTQDVTSLASCWEILRKDGTAIYLTDHDKDITFSGHLYLASAGYDRSSLKSSSGTDTDEMDLSGYLDSSWLLEEDLNAGKYDHAEIRFFLINWQSPNSGNIPLRRGWIGEVYWKEGAFKAELRGLSDVLKREVGQVYTPECLADFCDIKCKLDITQFMIIETVSEIVSSQIIKVSSFNGADVTLTGGICHFVSGLNAGLSVEVASWQQSSKEISFFLPPSFALAVGDQIRLVQGCDKRFSTCRDRFSNQVNFRGFPHIPGTSNILGGTYV